MSLCICKKEWEISVKWYGIISKKNVKWKSQVQQVIYILLTFNLKNWVK